MQSSTHQHPHKKRKKERKKERKRGGVRRERFLHLFFFFSFWFCAMSFIQRVCTVSLTSHIYYTTAGAQKAQKVNLAWNTSTQQYQQYNAIDGVSGQHPSRPNTTYHSHFALLLLERWLQHAMLLVKISILLAQRRQLLFWGVQAAQRPQNVLWKHAVYSSRKSVHPGRNSYYHFTAVLKKNPIIILLQFSRKSYYHFTAVLKKILLSFYCSSPETLIIQSTLFNLKT